jgi:hypothetical protein
MVLLAPQAILNTTEHMVSLTLYHNYYFERYQNIVAHKRNAY